MDDRLRNLRQDDAFPIERQYATVGLRWRRTVQYLAALDVAYHHERISDSVLYYNPNYFLNGPRRNYLEFSLVHTLNRRNTFAYPLTGQYAQLAVSYRAFLDHRTPNSLTVRGRYSRYVALGGPFYYALGATGQLRVARALAYPDNRALGYDVLVRGYDALCNRRPPAGPGAAGANLSAPRFGEAAVERRAQQPFQQHSAGILFKYLC